jgi:hypothetical protein
MKKQRKAINMSTSGTTAVAEKDIPALPQPILHNAPETVEAAVERIMELEMRLEDLSRAVEIASITRQFEILDGFKQQADSCLEKKIVIEQPSSGEDMKLTVITGTLDPDLLKKENA